MGQLLDSGNAKSGKQSQSGTAAQPAKKRFLTLADRVRMEEEEKALRERQHIRDEVFKQRQAALEEKLEQNTRKQEKRDAFVQTKGSKKKERNVY
jgi:hypothetical protein